MRIAKIGAPALIGLAIPTRVLAGGWMCSSTGAAVRRGTNDRFCGGLTCERSAASTGTLTRDWKLPTREVLRELSGDPADR